VSLSSARVGLRLARREVRRHPWRNALVLLMVLVPTFGMTVAVTTLRTGEWTAADRRVAENGQAEQVGDLRPRADAAEAEGRLRASLPAGSFVIEHTSPDRIRLDDARAYVNVSDLDLSAPVVDGRFIEVDGRLPENGDEAVVTGSVLRELDLSIGDRITPQSLDRELTIVGRVDPLAFEDEAVYVGDELTTGRAGFTQAFVDVDQLSSPVWDLEGWRFHLIDRQGWYSDDHSSAAFAWTYVGGAVALLVVGTVIAAAFAVGARRQLHTIGLLSSAGASPRTVRWFVVSQGVVGGAIGSVLGITLGLVGTRLVPERAVALFFDRPIEETVTRLADVLPIVAIGTIAAVGAAWIPARSAARVPTLQALAGRRPQARVPRRLPLLGLLGVGGGASLLALAVVTARGTANDVGTTLIAIAGSVAVLVGTLAVGPWVVGGLERLSRRWPSSGRLAGRSLSRSRLRSAAVVGALCAVCATLVAGTSVLQTYRDRDQLAEVDAVPDDQAVLLAYRAGGPRGRNADPAAAIDEVEQGILNRLPGTAVIDVPDAVGPRSEQPFHAVGGRPVDGATSGFNEERAVGIATPDWLDHLGVSDRLRAQLVDGQALEVGEDRGADQVVIATLNGSDLATVPVGGAIDAPIANALPRLLISPGRAAELGLGLPEEPRRLFLFDHALTRSERDDLSLLADDVEWSPTGNSPVLVGLYLPDEPPPLSESQIRAIGYGAILLLVGAGVAGGLALAAKDDEDENQVLSAVGAPPRTLRRVAALRAGLLVASATVIAVPAGLLAAWAMVAAAERDVYVSTVGVARTLGYRLHPDWITLGFVAIVLPVGVMVVALGGSWLRDLARRPRPTVFGLAD
jgi:putative ABC transport system permease protein